MAIESIPEDLRAFVSGELGSGRYLSLDDLLAEALRLLREHETFLEEHRDELRAQIAQGVLQAERGELVDGEEAMERLRRELGERQREG
jgi:antitoxin ParD1/3/4